MSAGTAGASRREVLRQTSATFVPAAVWVFCAAAVADAVIEGSWGYAVRVTVLMGTIAFAAWMLLASPCLVVEAEGVRVVNPLRVRWIPFGALMEVRVRGLTTLVARGVSGNPRDVTSWNAPGQPRRPGLAASVGEVVERSRAAWERRSGEGADTAVMVTTWRRRAVFVLILLVALNVAIWFR